MLELWDGELLYTCMFPFIITCNMAFKSVTCLKIHRNIIIMSCLPKKITSHLWILSRLRNRDLPPPRFEIEYMIVPYRVMIIYSIVFHDLRKVR